MEVEEVLALIEKIIEEHKQIFKGLRTLEKVANDASAMRGLDKAQGEFVPGRLGDKKQGLQNWQELLKAIDQGIRAHFNREETALVAAVEEYGDKGLATTLQAWLFEHNELRERLAKLKEDVANLAVDTSSQIVWQGEAWGIRVYMTHTYNLFERHTEGEQGLLMTLKKRLQVKVREKD